MRFVNLDVRRLNLNDTTRTVVVDGAERVEIEKHWIEVKKQLSKGEDAEYRTRGFRKLSPGEKKGGGMATEIDVDWKALAFSRAEAYITDWSARDDAGKPVKFSIAALGNLMPEDFDEIDAAIEKHIEEMTEQKKLTV